MAPLPGPGTDGIIDRSVQRDCRIRILLINSLLVRTKEMGVPFCKERKKKKKVLF